ncbi:HTTM domain-containing protein [Aegicerativicinus sediminis]|uniref:HTTM domain-containing protein n=1 Tax=Aegicerativicinus sediminis TaxID=2893202 RepID=UPI001E3A262C|nr:HTTM domain-containing protein [Aegicerativicinus sediminis]
MTSPKFLFTRIDNSPLIVFRIIFGFLVLMEGVGAIFTGWIKRTLIEPQETFTFIGFEWLQPLGGNGMYFYYAIMGLLGLLIMVGYKYRWSIFAFTLMWTATYLMQKSSYNNHYYLLILLSGIMAIVPANRFLSVDVKLNPSLKKRSMPNWCRWIFVLQMFIVYTYAMIAKLYPDWLDASVPKLLMAPKSDFVIVGDLLQERWVHYAIAYVGIFFDGLIVPLLLWKRTRKYAFIGSIFFHLFNSFIFHIGIFPYMSLGLCVFFFPPKTIQKIFFPKQEYFEPVVGEKPRYYKPAIAILTAYFIVQILLPLRHWAIKGDVLWTEEGHRLSWRMMLRSRSGNTTFKLVNTKTNDSIPIKLSDFLTSKQRRSVSTKPDVMWQFAQRLKRHYAQEGIEIKVFVDSKVSVNGGPHWQLIDPKVDLANVPWDHFRHNDWILLPN